MISKSVKVVNENGLHMRLAGIFAGEMSKFKSNTVLLVRNNRINAKSIMHIIASCVKGGTEITIECSGADEQEALARAVELIESGFGE